MHRKAVSTMSSKSYYEGTPTRLESARSDTSPRSLEFSDHLRTRIVALAFIAFAVAALFLIEPGMRVWWIPIVIWIGSICYAVVNFRQRVMLLAFLFTFGFFLLSKPILMAYLRYPGLGWTDEMSTHLVLVLCIGLVALVAGYATPDVRKSRGAKHSSRLRTSKKLTVISRFLFLATLPLSFLRARNGVLIADESGYSALYVGQGGAFASVDSYGHMANTIALCIFLATNPKRLATWSLIALATLPRALYVASGDRADFGTFLLLIFCYVVYRSRAGEDRLLSRRQLGFGILGCAVIVIPVFINVGLDRGVGASHATLIDFMYGQGASINVIEYGKSFEERIPDGIYLLLFTDQGLLRLITGNTAGLAGNSIGYALSGTSFSHSLSYVALGDLYLSGRGVGTSFLAEAYADLGYFGVGLIGWIYGLIIRWIDRYPLDQYLANTFRLIIIPAILFAPRGSASGFLSDLFSPLSLAIVLGVWLTATISAGSKRTNTS